MASITQPTRSSSRIRERKNAAAKAAAAATVKTNTTTKNARKGKTNTINKNARKGKGKTTASKIAKHTPAKKASAANTKKTNAAHHRFFMEPEQLSHVIDQHLADGNDQMWVGGKLYAAGPGEEVPVGAIEIEFNVPSGLKFLRFPHVLRLEETEEMEEEGEGEMEEDQDDAEDEKLFE